MHKLKMLISAACYHAVMILPTGSTGNGAYSFLVEWANYYAHSGWRTPKIDFVADKHIPF